MNQTLLASCPPPFHLIPPFLFTLLLKYRSGLPEALAIVGWCLVRGPWDFFKGVLKQRGQRENPKVRQRGGKACGWEMRCRSSGQNLAELEAGCAVGDRACRDDQSRIQSSKEGKIVLEASFHALWAEVWVGLNGY